MDDKMRIITVTSRKEGVFDVAPACKIYAGQECVGTVFAGKSLSFELADGEQTIYCAYTYGKHRVEKSNEIRISDAKNHDLVLGVKYSKTYMGRFNENIRTFFSKGYINVPDIELYEK